MKHGLSETVAKERKRLVRQISSELLGPIVGKMPKSSIESLEKSSYLENVARHIVDIIPMTHAEIVAHDVDPSFPPFFRREAVFAKRNLYVLRDAIVSPHSGMAWIGNLILEESVGSLRRIMDWGDMLHEPLLPVQELPLPGPVVVCHPASYYHWLLEVLPNLLFAIATFPEVKIVVPECCPEYVMAGLTTALGQEAAARFITCTSPVKVDTLVMPQYQRRSEFTSPQVVRLLQAEVKAKVVGAVPSRTARAGGAFYVSRRKGRRSLVGEALLEERLQERGVTIVHCEELSFSEQVRVFHEAATVIGIHGAGLSNLVWSQPPCRVIEIFPKNYLLDCFSWLSFCLGFDYRYVICRTGHELDGGAIDAVIDLL